MPAYGSDERDGEALVETRGREELDPAPAPAPEPVTPRYDELPPRPLRESAAAAASSLRERRSEEVLLPPVVRLDRLLPDDSLPNARPLSIRVVLLLGSSRLLRSLEVRPDEDPAPAPAPAPAPEPELDSPRTPRRRRLSSDFLRR